MKIWTMQPSSALEDLKRDGFYRCDEKRSFNLSKAGSLRPQYQWLIRRMEEKIGPMPPGVTYPIWAWYVWDYERRSPDPDSAAFVRRGADRVLLELEIDEKRVVLTDFDAWQQVLNGGYVSGASTREELAKEAERLEPMDLDEMMKAVEDSWENVFLTDSVKDELFVRGRYIQATFWQIEPSDIVKVTALSSTMDE